MKTLIITALAAILLSSCITEKKVKGWLNDNPTTAAGYCADNFPPDTVSKIIYDSVDMKAYEQAYMNMSYYADSLFQQLEAARNSFRPSPSQPCPPVVNLDSLRKVVDAEIKKRLTPCKDSIKVVERTIVDKAREKQMQGKIDEKDAVISARDKTISEKDAKIKSKNKYVWMFWGLVVLIGVYVFAKLKLKLPF
jgi:hypothetical protein